MKATYDIGSDEKRSLDIHARSMGLVVEDYHVWRKERMLIQLEIIALGFVSLLMTMLFVLR